MVGTELHHFMFVSVPSPLLSYPQKNAGMEAAVAGKNTTVHDVVDKPKLSKLLT